VKIVKFLAPEPICHGLEGVDVASVLVREADYLLPELVEGLTFRRCLGSSSSRRMISWAGRSGSPQRSYWTSVSLREF
jgi:hypothetical protein